MKVFCVLFVFVVISSCLKLENHDEQYSAISSSILSDDITKNLKLNFLQNRLVISGGCNVLSIPFNSNGTFLELDQKKWNSTLMFCEGDPDQQITEAINKVVRIQKKGSNDAVLLDKYGKILFVLKMI